MRLCTRRVRLNIRDVASVASPTCGFIVQIDKYGTNVISGSFVLSEIEE